MKNVWKSKFNLEFLGQTRIYNILMDKNYHLKCNDSKDVDHDDDW
jgi:hypothetical protein